MLYEKNHKLVQGYECLSACLGFYFYQDNPCITGSEICICGGGLDITYDLDTHIIGSPIYEANFQFMDRNGVVYEHDYWNPEENRKEFLSHCVKEEKRIALKVSGSLLNYSRVFKQTENSSHYINILGETANQYYVCDCYVPTRQPSLYEGWVEKDVVIGAWKAKNNEYVILSEWKLDSDKIKEEIDKSILDYSEYYMQGNDSTGIIQGETAIRQMLHYAGSQINNPNLHQIAINMNYQLKIYGFVSSKMMLVEVLKKDKNYADVIVAYESVIAEWNNICIYLIKYGITQRKAMYDKLLDRAEQVMEKERMITGRIRERRT